MNKYAKFPYLGFVLREIITSIGYRKFFEEKGLDKNLDDLAIESDQRKSTLFELFTEIEDQLFVELSKDCGYEWAQFFWQVWINTKSSYQYLVRNVDLTPIPPEYANELFIHEYVNHMLCGFLVLVNHNKKGPELNDWLSSPFKSWVSFAERLTKKSSKTILEEFANKIDVDQRSIERWLAGEPISKVVWPFTESVRAITDKQSDVSLLTGWLLLTCAFQTVSTDLRDQIRRYLSMRKQDAWDLEQAISKMNESAFYAGNHPVRAEMIGILTQLESQFSISPEGHRVESLLQTSQKLINENPVELRSSYQYLFDWFSAKHAAMKGETSSALKHYADAISIAWWSGGPNVKPILDEALMYAVGVGAKAFANVIWDKNFILGLSHAPKRPLDDLEIRRIAIAFEHRFAPLKAKHRVPPKHEISSNELEFSLSDKDLQNPNRQIKYAEGRTRRAPLMNAVFDGTLSDVQTLILSGANPNSFIPESGEGPLSYAMRRACDRKDPIIMQYLLTLELTPETVNRASSSNRETPLKLAIEMADSHAVKRLIELGANVEMPCDYLPSALCFAMMMFYHSLYPEDTTQQEMYLNGLGRADGYDAKDGYILDVDVSVRRNAIKDLMSSNDRHRKIFNGTLEYFRKSPQDYRELIKVLVSSGADCNKQYRVQIESLARWTPTLFAAQVGDIDVFKTLIEHHGSNKGDLNSVLLESNTFSPFDALWVAVLYRQHDIVNYLKSNH
jgi:ankyrin repeat protein